MQVLVFNLHLLAPLDVTSVRVQLKAGPLTNNSHFPRAVLKEHLYWIFVLKVQIDIKMLWMFTVKEQNVFPLCSEESLRKMKEILTFQQKHAVWWYCVSWRHWRLILQEFEWKYRIMLQSEEKHFVFHIWLKKNENLFISDKRGWKLGILNRWNLLKVFPFHTYKKGPNETVHIGAHGR